MKRSSIAVENEIFRQPTTSATRPRKFEALQRRAESALVRLCEKRPRRLSIEA